MTELRIKETTMIDVVIFHLEIRGTDLMLVAERNGMWQNVYEVSSSLVGRHVLNSIVVREK